MLDPERQDTPDVAAFKADIIAVCEKHDLHFDRIAHGNLGVWRSAYGSPMQAIRYAEDMSSQELINAYMAAHTEQLET